MTWGGGAVLERPPWEGYMWVKTYRKKGAPWLPCHHSKSTLQPSTEALDSTLFATQVNCPGGPVVKNPPPMQATQVPSLVWEESTCCGATNLYDTTTEPVGHSCWSPRTLKPMFCNQRSPHMATREQPLLAATRENPHVAMKAQRRQK